MTNYLITGGAGFIGSHLSEELLAEGHQVTIIDDLSTGKFENIEHLTDNPNFHFAIDTILNNNVLDRLASECDVIYHLAAAVGVRLVVEKPILTIETNFKGTEAVLKTALRYRAKVIVTSTSEVYGKGDKLPFKEDDDVLFGPTVNSRWTYAGSKMMDEFLALAYWQEKGLPVVVCRLFNTIGPRQTGRYGMVVPRFVQQALSGEQITVYGDGEQRRSFTWVGDVVRALAQLAITPEAVGEVYNLGQDKDISINELAELIKEMTGSSSEIKLIPYKEAYKEGFEDMRRRLPDISKIKSLIEYQHTKQLRDILDIVIAYEKERL
ncbi:GDP-mannose 4,6-dehydratase [bacterium]|nr:GDP-mannose 4,6-dehydratase [bacterium]